MKDSDCINPEVWNELSASEQNSFLAYCELIGIDTTASLIAVTRYISRTRFIFKANNRLHAASNSYGINLTPLSREDVLKMGRLGTFNED